jgi:hypothetical protein
MDETDGQRRDARARPGNLSLALLRPAEVTPALATILATRSEPTPWGSVELNVIGASSLIILERPDGALAELVSCLPLGPTRCLGSAGVVARPGASAEVGCSGSGWRYTGRLWTTLPDQPAPAPLPLVLQHRFGGPRDPLTEIHAAVEPAGLRLWTRHDYPEWGVAVWTESRWVLR